jgi:hypothetical protein
LDGIKFFRLGASDAERIRKADRPSRLMAR